MSQIILRFVRSPSLGSGFVRLFTWSDWSHVEFYTPSGYLGSQAFTKPPGVQLRDFNYQPNAEYVFRYVDCTQEQYDKCMSWAMGQIDKPYDFSAILGLGFHRDWREQDSWFCSEFVAFAIEQCGIPLLREPVNRITPGMLFDLEEVHP